MADTFPIVPAGARSTYMIVALIVVITALLALVLTILGTALNAAHNAEFEISAEGLRIKNAEFLYKRFIPAGQLRRMEARVISLREEPEFQLKRRTLGTGLPGYAGGWYRLHNGEKALVYLTQRKRVVYLPTNAGFVVLLSPKQPDRFVERVRSISGT